MLLNSVTKFYQFTGTRAVRDKLVEKPNVMYKSAVQMFHTCQELVQVSHPMHYPTTVRNRGHLSLFSDTWLCMKKLNLQELIKWFTRKIQRKIITVWCL